MPELIPVPGLFHGKAVARFLTGERDGAAHGHIAKAYVTVIALAAERAEHGAVPQRRYRVRRDGDASCNGITVKAERAQQRQQQPVQLMAPASAPPRDDLVEKPRDREVRRAMTEAGVQILKRHRLHMRLQNARQRLQILPRLQPREPDARKISAEVRQRRVVFVKHSVILPSFAFFLFYLIFFALGRRIFDGRHFWEYNPYNL